MVLLHEAFPELGLIGRRRVGHVKNLVERTDVVFRVAMAVQAPLHGQRRSLPSERHFIDTAMAAFAPDAFVNVNTVIEVDELRQIVHARPLDRLAGPVAFPYGLEHRTGGPHLRVAVHADFRGGDIRERRLLDGRVAVAAIDPQAADMMLVTEWDRLLSGSVLHHFIGRPNDEVTEPHEKR